MIKKIIIVLFALILSIVAFEYFLTYSPFSYGLSPVRYDKDIGMWHKRNFSSYTISECYKTKYSFDSNGLVFASYPYNNKNNDILILGDSFIEANMVRNENILHNVLWSKYKGKYNFLNYGLSGTSPTQQFVILKKKAYLSNAKAVIQFINIDNDIYDVLPKNLGSLSRPKVFVKFFSLDNYLVIPPREPSIKDTVMDILGNYHIYIPIKKSLYLIKKYFKKRKIKKETKNKEKDLSKNWLQIEGAIYQTKIFLEGMGIEYKIIFYSENKENVFKLTKILHKYRIPFINIKEKATLYQLKLPHFKCDRHWNDSAHKNIATIIYKSNFLERN